MADPRLDVLANLPLFAALHTGVMQNSEGGSAGTTGGPLILWPTYRTMLAPGRRAISPGADGLCTISALTQLEARLIQLSLWDTLGTSPWEDWRWLCGRGWAAAWGWRSRKAPRPRSEQAALSVPGPQLAGGPGRTRSGLGRRCQGDPRWAGDGQRRRYHERPEAQLHLRCLWRVGASPVCECMCSAGALLGCHGLRGGEGCGGCEAS